jgi:hypothetical protein
MFGYLVAMVPVLLLEQPTRKVAAIDRRKFTNWNDDEAFGAQTGNKRKLSRLILARLQCWVIWKLPECQGMTACRISYDNNNLDGWIMLWGGRTSPTRPQGTIYLWDPQTQRLATPNDIRGAPPTPCWGHSVVTVSGNRMAVVGRCNHEEGALGDVYLLQSKEALLQPTQKFLPPNVLQTIQRDLACGRAGTDRWTRCRRIACRCAGMW